MKLINKLLLSAVVLFCIHSANAAWTKQDSGTLAWLRSVHFVNQETGWIAGSGGVVLKTIDGGKTWKQTMKITKDNIRDVYFSDESNGWLLCEHDIYKGNIETSPSYLLHTSDGGDNWRKLNFGEASDRMARFFFTNTGTGFGVGENGKFWKSQGSLKGWKSFDLPVRFIMLDGVFTDELRGSVVGGGGTILYTEDGGSSWNKATLSGTSTAKLNSVFFANSRSGWAAGATGKVFYTNNGGKFWRDQTTNIKDNLFSIFFLDQNVGYAAGDNGTILRTINAGDTWSREPTGVKHRLEQIFFIKNRGYAVGYGGTILMWDEQKSL